MSRATEECDALNSSARFVGRVVGPFVDYHEVIIVGTKLYFSAEGDVLPDDLASMCVILSIIASALSDPI